VVAAGEGDGDVVKVCGGQDEVSVNVRCLAVNVIQLVNDNEDVVGDGELLNGTSYAILEPKSGREFSLVPDRRMGTGIDEQDITLPFRGDTGKYPAFTDSPSPVKMTFSLLRAGLLHVPFLDG